MEHAEVWDEATARAYDADTAAMNAPEVLGPTVDRLVELAAGGAALELAVGTGRVAVPLAARGVPVTGVELSEAMVAQLRAKVDARRIPVVVGDMAHVRVAGTFSLVYLVFNTISNLLDQSEQVACFANAAAHLGPGGRFVVELTVPDLQRLPVDRAGVVFEVDEGRVGLDTYDVVAQHLVSHHFRFGAGHDGETRTTLFRSRHRYVWPAELDLMARLAGFALEGRTADWAGAPFTATSGSHVSVYRLPGS